MCYYILILCLVSSAVLETSARPQYQCAVPCAFTQPVSPGSGYTPTLNIVVRTESQEKPSSMKTEQYPPPSPPSPCRCPPSPCCCCQSPPASRGFCASVCALPGAIMDSILSGEVNF